MKQIAEKVTHTLEPIYNSNSTILILGTFPSVKSREGNFYYHNPQNRFWKVISRLFEEELPVSIDEKRNLLLTHNIAIWDVVQSCKIKGSDDFTIQDIIPNDIKTILNKSKITKIYGNGGKAYDLYVKYCFEKTKVEMTKLPSTSPANAAFSLDKLLQIWNKELNC